MSIAQLLRWQWEGYPQYHRSRTNLLLHILLVPLFILANTVALLASVERAWLIVVIAVAAMAVSIALQGRGHRQEPTPPEPFTSPINAMSRILLEQWVTFPRFVLSGGWSHAMRAAA